jgi:hypothetical protein
MIDRGAAPHQQRDITCTRVVLSGIDIIMIHAMMKRCGVRILTTRGTASSSGSWAAPSYPKHFHCCYTTSAPVWDLSKYYRVEVSNAARPDATKITVRGPDVDGILASMTVALAQEGCSLKELHAGYANANLSETLSYEHRNEEGSEIEDIFFVAQHTTGKPFPDEALPDLGKTLLKALRKPMACLSGKTKEDDEKDHQQHTKDSQITVVTGSGTKCTVSQMSD